MKSSPTVALIVGRAYLRDRALSEMLRTLEAAGCGTEVVVPDPTRLFEVPDRAPSWDAVLSRGRDLAGLGLLAAASALGVLAINRPDAIQLVRNKIAMHAILLEHGLALPKTWFAADVQAFRELPPERFPIVVKPFDGDRSRGLSFLSGAEDLDLIKLLPESRALYLAQEFLETDGFDLKLYGVGSQVWAVRKRSPVSFPRPGPAVFKPTGRATLVPLDPQLRDIALTCGRSCGLELWGVDVALTPKGPYVIEINDFPTYSAIPEAGYAIARHVLALVEINTSTSQMGRDQLRSIVRGLA